MKIHFFEMEKIVVKFGITVIWFYGESVHGRGLIDAMTFECKQQLRHELISNDSWFRPQMPTTWCNFSRNIFQATVIKSITVWLLLTQI